MITLDRARPGVAAQAVGLAQGALDLAIEYTHQRKQFGQSISSFQGIQWMLADMAHPDRGRARSSCTPPRAHRLRRKEHHASSRRCAS